MQQLSQTFPAIDYPEPFICEGPVFDTVNEAIVGTILSNFSNSKAKDIVAWTLPFLKLHKDSVISSLTTVINKFIYMKEYI